MTNFAPDLQLFQSFPTKVAQNDLEWPIFPNLQLFQCFPTEVAQNDSEWPILPTICNYSNLFPPKWLRMTRNGQFCSICNFSNVFPLKWLRMTQNGQFHPICNFSNLFSENVCENERIGSCWGTCAWHVP